MNYRVVIAVLSGLLLLIVIGLAVGEQGSPIAPLGVDTLPPSAP
jgi:hypothetical protein